MKDKAAKEYVVKQTDVLKSLITMLGQQFNCPIYADEVKDNFRKPCFFISFNTITIPQTVNITDKQMTVFLTYFPEDTKKNEITYLEVFDNATTLLGRGFFVGKRFIHIHQITEQRIGEEMDILQLKIELKYSTIATEESTAELMEEVYVRYENKN